MKNLIGTFLLTLSIFTTHTAYGQDENLTQFIRASAKVLFKSGSGGGTAGSAVAVRHYRGGTLLLSNDHVCQWSRGPSFFGGSPDYDSALNTVTPKIYTTNHKRMTGRVVYVSNTSNPDRNGRFKEDLCLIYVPYRLPIVDISIHNPPLGEEVISVSAPHRYFPVVTDGYVGKRLNKRVTIVSLQIGAGSSGSGVISKKTGKIVGVAYAIRTHSKLEHSPMFALMIPSPRIMRFLRSYFRKQNQ